MRFASGSLNEKSNLLIDGYSSSNYSINNKNQNKNRLNRNVIAGLAAVVLTSIAAVSADEILTARSYSNILEISSTIDTGSYFANSNQDTATYQK